MSNQEEPPQGPEHDPRLLDGHHGQSLQATEGDGTNDGARLNSPSSMYHAPALPQPETSQTLADGYGSAPGHNTVGGQAPNFRMRNPYEETPQLQVGGPGGYVPASSSGDAQPSRLGPNLYPASTSLNQVQNQSSHQHHQRQNTFQHFQPQNAFQQTHSRDMFHHVPRQFNTRGAQHTGGFHQAQNQSNLEDTQRASGIYRDQNRDSSQPIYSRSGFANEMHQAGAGIGQFQPGVNYLGGQQSSLQQAPRQQVLGRGTNASNYPQVQGGFEPGQVRDNFPQVPYQGGVQHNKNLRNLLPAQQQSGLLPTQHQKEFPSPGYPGGVRFAQFPSNAQPIPVNAQMPPLNLGYLSFKDTRTAKVHLCPTGWRPKTGTIGIPRFPEERDVYVKRIYDAIVDLSDIQDADLGPEIAARFHAGTGMWAHPRDIEATARVIVDTALKLHQKGVQGLPFLRDSTLQPGKTDSVLTFAERMFFVEFMLRHYKLKADIVMRGRFIDEYVARIWSDLKWEPFFMRTWGGLAPAQFFDQLEAVAYQHTKQNPPSRMRREEIIQQFDQEAQGVQQQQGEEDEEDPAAEVEEASAAEVEGDPAEEVEEASLPPRKRRNVDSSE